MPFRIFAYSSNIHCPREEYQEGIIVSTVRQPFDIAEAMEKVEVMTTKRENLKTKMRMWRELDLQATG
jgi:hypothetical protein